MQNKSTAVNIRRLNIQMGSGSAGGRAVLSLDAAKSSNSFKWPFLWAVLCRLGFGPNYISCVRLLYKAPSARIRVNGLLSNSFVLNRGTRQGCLLSPLLLALVIEPLACLIRTSPDVSSFRSGDLEERLSLYADDMLLYLGDSVVSIAPVMLIIREFGAWSGLLINWQHLYRIDAQINVVLLSI